MSYQIERGKRVLIIPVGADERYKIWDTHLYLQSASDNNISPRIYEWNLIATDIGSTWGSEIMLPMRCWEMAHYADGGGIKPWDKDTTGINYIKAWKTAAAKAKPIFDGDALLWFPKIGIWIGNDNRGLCDKLRVEGVNLFKGYEKEKAFEAYQRLFPDGLDGAWISQRVRTKAEILDAVYLWRNREKLPFPFSIESDENDPFLKANGDS